MSEQESLTSCGAIKTSLNLVIELIEDSWDGGEDGWFQESGILKQFKHIATEVSNLDFTQKGTAQQDLLITVWHGQEA